jgi:hypothetical protein
MAEVRMTKSATKVVSLDDTSDARHIIGRVIAEFIELYIPITTIKYSR